VGRDPFDQGFICSVVELSFSIANELVNLSLIVLKINQNREKILQ
jgi:hypothetical protein